MVEISDTEMVVSTEVEVTPTTTRRRRKKSLVWEHFTIEAGSGGSTRACCKLCKQTFAYSCGSKVAGTSHLKRHITLGSCPMIKDQQRKKLALTSAIENGGAASDPPPKRRYRYTGFSNTTFDHDRSVSYLAKMIILHDYPLHIVQQPAFITFIESLQPRFRVSQTNTIEAEVLDVYHKEKQNLMHAFAAMPGRISLAISLWTTTQTLGYISLSGQFIDADWKLHRRMLNFVMVSSHSENAFSEAVSASLSEWNMKERLFTVSLDGNCSSHDISSRNLKDHLSNKNSLMLKGQLFVVRCFASVLNEIAQDVLASVHGIIYNIRESIKFIKAVPSREEKFADIALQLEIPGTRTLCLDVTTQWNTTYLMLQAGLDYKQAFTVLETCDDKYNEAPSSDDWKKVEAVCTYLKFVYDAANVTIGAAEPTANIFFQEAWKIQQELTNGSSSDDPTISSIATDMHEKFDEYWKDCSLVLAIAIVMDPRFKMKLVEFSYFKLYGADAAKHIKVVNDAIHDLYQEYVAQPLPLTPAYVEQGEANQFVSSDESNALSAAPAPALPADGLQEFELYLSETAMNQPPKPELEQYLAEELVPRSGEFDILQWWKLNVIKYPTLSKMARDVLAVPMSIVGAGSSIFGSGTGKRMLSDYQSSLQPSTLEAIFCAKDWLQYLPTTVELPGSAIVKMEI